MQEKHVPLKLLLDDIEVVCFINDLLDAQKENSCQLAKAR